MLSFLRLNFHLQNKTAILQIFNMLGELIATDELEKNSTEKIIGIGSLASGVYAVRVMCEGAGVVKRFVKE